MTGFEWNLDNWIRYCRKRDWLPRAHVSQIAIMMKHAKQGMANATDPDIPAYEEEALKFNDLILKLPNRLRIVFLLNHLDKGIENGTRIVYSAKPEKKYNLAKVSKATFHRYAQEADSMLKRWVA